jgi:co-chaperonin GroES (HSP10)
MKKEYPHAIGYRVVILPDKVEEKSAGGIVLPNKDVKLERAATTNGTIVDIGPMVEHGVKDLEPGSRVVYAKYAGKFVENPDDEDNDFVIVNDEDIISEMKEEGYE